ncbi:MAG: hypothetical protein KF799_07655 [Bdellovibrionales bacterium]|nr:hypothetical protein [Bdellovibrionales bacterium]
MTTLVSYDRISDVTGETVAIEYFDENHKFIIAVVMHENCKEGYVIWNEEMTTISFILTDLLAKIEETKTKLVAWVEEFTKTGGTGNTSGLSVQALKAIVKQDGSIVTDDGRTLVVFSGFPKVAHLRPVSSGGFVELNSFLSALRSAVAQS